MNETIVKTIHDIAHIIQVPTRCNGKTANPAVVVRKRSFEVPHTVNMAQLSREKQITVAKLE